MMHGQKNIKLFNMRVYRHYSSNIMNQNAEALKWFYQLQTGGSISLPYNDQGGLRMGYTRGAQFPGTTSSWSLNFVRWRLMFWDLLMSPFGHLEFWVGF